MARPRNNLRLFVAAYPPREIAGAMLDALRTLNLPAYRPVRLDQVHMTLQFIGDTPAKDLEAKTESVQRAAGGLAATELTPLKLIALPKRGRARLIAAETDGPATLLELQRRLASRLAKSPREKPGNRFLPHITLCRFQSPARIQPLDKPLDLPTFSLSELKLMRSTLHPQGAEHHEVASFTLG